MRDFVSDTLQGILSNGSELEEELDAALRTMREKVQR